MPACRVGRGAAALVVIALVGAHLPASAQGAGGITESYAITNDAVEPQRRFEAFDATAVGVFDLDGDGVMEIIAHNDNNRAYVFDGGTGALVAEIETRHPRSWDARELAGIAVGDVNGNGIPDLVIANSVGWVTAFEARAPSEPTATLTLTKLWEYFVDPPSLDPNYFENRSALQEEYTGFVGLDGAVFLADATGDGKDEVFFQTDDYPGHFALNSDGTLRWWIDWGDGNASPVVDDLDGDGRLEVVFVTDGGRVFVFDAKGGHSRCTFHAKAHGARPASISVSARLADVTGDGRKEIVFGTRQAVEDKGDPEWFRKQNAHYFALRSNCSLLWHKTFAWGNPHIYMRAAPADVNGDGNLDLIFQDWNTIGHKPGEWQVTGKSNVFALEGSTGKLLWRTPVDTYWSNKDVAVADVLGTGRPQVLVVAPKDGEDGITLLGMDGKFVGFVGVGKGWDVSRGPTVADLSGDGNLDVLVPVYRKAEGCPQRNLDVGCREGAIKVFATGSSATPVWDGVFLFSRTYDYFGKERRLPVPRVEVEQPDAALGNLAVVVKGDAEATNLFVKRVGTTEWVGIPPVGGNRFEAALAPPPTSGETFFVRVTLQDTRVAYSSLEWEGRGDGAVDVVVTQVSGKPMVGVAVEVTLDGRHVASLTTGSDGSVRFEGAPGTYAVTASASGREPKTTEAEVRPGEISRAVIALERSGFMDEFPPRFAVSTLAIASVLLVAGTAALAVGVARRSRRDAHDRLSR